VKDTQPHKSIGGLIKAERVKRNLSQTRLAEILTVSPSYVSRLEAGQVVPSLELAESIAHVLNLPDFSSTVERVRLESYQNQMISRREMSRTRRPKSQRKSRFEQKAEAIARDMLNDPELEGVFDKLKTALSKPRIREITIAAIEAFANSGNPSQGFRLAAKHFDPTRLRRYFIDNPIPLFLTEVSVTIEPNDDDIILHFQNSQFDLEEKVVTIQRLGRGTASDTLEKTIHNNDVMFSLSELGLTVRQLDRIRFRIELAKGREVEGSLL
jgi:transcriptional regulator with XRE-family HTH domain